MLKNSMSDFFLGSLAIILGITIMIIFPLFKISIHPITALPFLIIGILLINTSLSAVTEHATLISKYFLKKTTSEKRLKIISETILLCLFEDYSKWWKDQKNKRLNSAHVSFGIFVVIMAGIANKKDILEYSKHLNDCPNCQNYLKPWTEILSQKIRKLERS